eukprot:2827874-Amphidinium_carterae.1
MSLQHGKDDKNAVIAPRSQEGGTCPRPPGLRANHLQHQAAALAKLWMPRVARIVKPSTNETISLMLQTSHAS